MAKKFQYRGYDLETLQGMSLDEVVKMLPSRVRRSLKKGFTDPQKKLIARVKKARKSLTEGKEYKPIKTHCRDMPILPEMIGLKLKIYNGKEFFQVEFFALVFVLSVLQDSCSYPSESHSPIGVRP